MTSQGTVFQTINKVIYGKAEVNLANEIFAVVDLDITVMQNLDLLADACSVMSIIELLALAALTTAPDDPELQEMLAEGVVRFNECVRTIQSVVYKYADPRLVEVFSERGADLLKQATRQTRYEEEQTEQKIYEQLRQVRDSGLYNMLDLTGIKCYAEQTGLEFLAGRLGAITKLPRSERSKLWMKLLNSSAERDESEPVG
jgi:hypothetical protein